MYTVLLYQNWIKNVCIPIGSPIGPSSKLYKENQSTIKLLLSYRITPKFRPLDILITDIHENLLRKIYYMVDTISNMQQANLNSKTHGVPSIRDIIDSEIGARF